MLNASHLGYRRSHAFSSPVTVCSGDPEKEGRVCLVRTASPQFSEVRIEQTQGFQGSCILDPVASSFKRSSASCFWWRSVFIMSSYVIMVTVAAGTARIMLTPMPA